MESNGRIEELLSLILDEQRGMRREMKELNERTGKVEAAVDRLQLEQYKTNALLTQHNRDLVRIADILQEDTPQFGQAIEFEVLNATEKGQRVLIKKP
ncbi:MAG: hypothetical protein IAF08_04185 [Rhizobacter sp.]|nr:hypothetical protein [Chlorobiales bacterium]